MTHACDNKGNANAGLDTLPNQTFQLWVLNRIVSQQWYRIVQDKKQALFFL